MQERITKRLHVSGLTPNVTSSDLFRRFSNFGKVKAIHGFELLDGVGHPRKFGYLTIETTESDLRKCLNSFSGSMYKGARLRIAEAKPDFRERYPAVPTPPVHPEYFSLFVSIAGVNASIQPDLKFRRTRCSGVHHSDMSLVTPQNVHMRGRDWKVTPTGRILRNMRMRPGKPLALTKRFTDTPEIVGDTRMKRKVTKIKRCRTPSMARRTTIDMVKSGSVHLRGTFLASGLRTDIMGQSQGNGGAHAEGSTCLDGERDDESVDDLLAGHGDSQVERKYLSIQDPSLARESPSEGSPPSQQKVDLVSEIADSLNILETLFGDREWGGRENVLDLDEGMHIGAEVSFISGQPQIAGQAGLKQDTLPSETPGMRSNLEDLFTTQDDGAQFSLLRQLDLEFESDYETLISPIQRPRTHSPPVEPRDDPSTAQVSVPFVPHRSQTLFFPVINASRKLKDPIAVAKDRGWDWRNPAVAFYRTQSEEDIRKRWEDAKLILTRDWKRQWREACKARRRRSGVDGMA